MKITFFGTSEFAIPALEAIINSRHKLASVITQPRKQKGRGLKVLPTAIEECAKKFNGLKVLKFEDINSEAALEAVKGEGADIFVVVAFGQILNEDILKIPRLYPINIHASLLPACRGAAPMQRAIINGDKETGITIIRMNEFLDKGDIITQLKTEIGEDETALSLSRRLSALGAKLLIETLEKIEYGRVSFLPQDEAKATYAPKLTKEDGLINWGKEAAAIRNLIRGSIPWPSAYTYLDGKLLKILEADISDVKATIKPGSIIETGKEAILVACKDKPILVKKLQLEGKKPLAAGEFLRGRPLASGKILG